MSLLKDVVYKSWPKTAQLIKLEKSKINLKPLKKLTVRFDPFNDDVDNIRKFTHGIYEADIVKTNPKCIIKTEILSNRSDSHIVFDLIDGKQFIFKCKNLTCLEIFQLMNEHITPLAPEENVVTEPPKQKIKKKK